MTKKRIAALICAAAAIAAVIADAAAFLILKNGIFRSGEEPSQYISYTVRATSAGEQFDSETQITFDSEPASDRDRQYAEKELARLQTLAERQLEAIRRSPGVAFSSGQLASMRKIFGGDLTVTCIMSLPMESDGASESAAHPEEEASAFGIRFLRGRTLVDIRANADEYIDGYPHTLNFFMKAWDINRLVLSDRVNRTLLCGIPAAMLLIGAFVMLLSMREYDKKARLAAAEKTLFSAASQGLTKPLADIKRTCGAALGGDSADLQAMYDDILELNDEVLRLLSQARKT